MAGGKTRPIRACASHKPTPTIRRRSGPDRPLAAAVVIVVVGLCTFWNSLDLPFLWDDETAIVTNNTIRELRPAWRPLLTPVESPVTARPLVNLSFALTYAMSGLNVRGYHAWNLAVHLIAALVLFGVVRRTLEHDALRRRTESYAVTLALLAALWWVVHPLISEVIDYNTQRTTAMMGLFFLLTLYCAIRAIGSAHAARWHASAVFASACGMASKEEMVVAPIAVALYDRLFVYSTIRGAWGARKHLYVGLASTWVLLGVLMWRWPRSTVGFAAGDPWIYALNQADVISHYLRLAVWPSALVVDYGLPRQVAIGEVIGAVIFVAALLVVAILSLGRWPRLGFLGIVFFLTLAPTSSIVPIASEVGAERRMYLPLAALSVLLVLAGSALVSRASSLQPRRARAINAAALVFAAAWIGLLAARTVYRNAQYADPVALWHSSLEQRPHGRAHFGYAVALINAGQSEAALPHLREAVRTYRPARYALGVELAARGDSAEAIPLLESFIDDDPAATSRLPARLLLGRLYFAQARPGKSAEQFRAAADMAPSNVDAQLSLGDLLTSQKRFAEAASHYRAALTLQPDRPQWYLRLARALDQNGEPQAAAAAYARALASDPALLDTHLHLAEMWLRHGRADKAIPHARDAVQSKSRDSDAHQLLGAALARNGQLADAAEHFRTALELDPGNQLARSSLGRAEDLLDRR
jgi:tetratricopeptide (TPR) repeat protein